MIRLECSVRPYDWGGVGAISGFLGRDLGGGPEAELWLGAHPGWPTHTCDGRILGDVVAEDPEDALGTRGIARFGKRLPFLLKVLAAGKPLSLQVHPTPEQARAGAAAEDAAGVPRDAPHRNYKDDQAKPEMMVAVQPMRALCGFRPPRQVLADLEALLGQPGAQGAADEVHAALVAALAGPDEGAALRGCLELLLGGDPAVRVFVDRLVGACAAATAGADGGADRGTASVVRLLAATHPGDPGIAVSLLLNDVHLAPGEAVFLGAGTVHAYLQGLGVEVMNNSDNVLRGGLTRKHVDVGELVRIVRFAPETPRRVEPVEDLPGRLRYLPPAEEFQLQRVAPAVGAEVPLEQSGATVVLVAAGDLELVAGEVRLRLGQGDSAFVPASERGLRARALSAGALAYAATAGD
ncbi:mannose-6-phosphate isomerase, class I [Kineococcus xinjiangensis]|uniref:mannose-6-phosphate isomerase, class I n=1 Tax=Kineococcus xinjiangensis TaxID=512762 RepID=UPI001304BE9A|nr:mannose-6-phosphate isomerase, class I [Kineococcus xinjiangensis]